MSPCGVTRPQWVNTPGAESREQGFLKRVRVQLTASVASDHNQTMDWHRTGDTPLPDPVNWIIITDAYVLHQSLICYRQQYWTTGTTGLWQSMLIWQNWQKSLTAENENGLSKWRSQPQQFVHYHHFTYKMLIILFHGYAVIVTSHACLLYRQQLTPDLQWNLSITTT